VRPERRLDDHLIFHVTFKQAHVMEMGEYLGVQDGLSSYFKELVTDSQRGGSVTPLNHTCVAFHLNIKLVR
jgi:hypothetical protein